MLVGVFATVVCTLVCALWLRGAGDRHAAAYILAWLGCALFALAVPVFTSDIARAVGGEDVTATFLGKMSASALGAVVVAELGLLLPVVYNPLAGQAAAVSVAAILLVALLVAGEYQLGRRTDLQTRAEAVQVLKRFFGRPEPTEQETTRQGEGAPENQAVPDPAEDAVHNVSEERLAEKMALVAAEWSSCGWELTRSAAIAAIGRALHFDPAQAGAFFDELLERKWVVHRLGNEVYVPGARSPGYPWGLVA